MPSATTYAPRHDRPAPTTLDELAAEHFDALERRYRDADTPSSVRGLDGAPIGRMLAVRRVEASALWPAVRRFASREAFPWGGKSFTSRTAVEGDGINRVRLPGVLGRQTLFPFETAIGPSELDGRAAIRLDYDLAANPPWIRRIHDEVREVAPGLYLGPAMWKGRRGPVTLLWFALRSVGRTAG